MPNKPTQFIKPCEKCHAEIFDIVTDFLTDETYISCDNCHHRGPVKESALQAIAAWNTRKEQPHD